MADTNDTIDGLLAEFRGYSAGMPPSYHVTMSWHDFRRMLDRFDAAWKRDTKELRKEIERLKEERNYSGVRERERLRAKGFAIVPKEKLELGDYAKLREVVECVAHMNDDGYWNSSAQICNLVALASAALAAPPRNCDLPEVAKAQPNLAEQAWRVFRRSHKDSNLDAYGLLRCIRWLLAPAAEKEGDAK